MTIISFLITFLLLHISSQNIFGPKVDPKRAGIVSSSTQQESINATTKNFKNPIAKEIVSPSEFRKDVVKKAATRGVEEDIEIEIFDPELKKLGLKATDPSKIKGSIEEMQQNKSFKDFLTEQIENYIQCMEGALAAFNLIFGGPPGTGKTFFMDLLAKALYLSCYKNLLYFNINSAVLTEGELIASLCNEMINQAKANQKICILFLDEIDGFAKARDLGGDINVVAALLQGTNEIKKYNEYLQSQAQEQNYSQQNPCPFVAIFAATNYPNLVDAAIMSRFTYFSVLNPNPAALSLIYAKTIADGVNERIRYFLRKNPKAQNLKEFDMRSDHPLIFTLVSKGGILSPRELSQMVIKPFMANLRSEKQVQDFLAKIKPTANMTKLDLKNNANDLYRDHFEKLINAVKKAKKDQIMKDFSMGTIYLNNDPTIQNKSIQLIKYNLGWTGDLNHFEYLSTFISSKNNYMKNLSKGLPVKTNELRVLEFNGPPGGGKTELVKSIAREMNFNLIIIKSASLTDKMQGSGPANIEKCFQVAEAFAPCILFFDEAEEAAPPRGNDASGKNKDDQTVSLLTALNSNENYLNPDAPVVIAFATNAKIDDAVERRCNPYIFTVYYPNTAGAFLCIQVAVDNFNNQQKTSISVNQSSIIKQDNGRKINILSKLFIKDSFKKDGQTFVYWKKLSTDDLFKITTQACQKISAKNKKKLPYTMTADDFLEGVKVFVKDPSKLMYTQDQINKVLEKNKSANDGKEYILDQKYFNEEYNNFSKDIPERKDYLQYADKPLRQRKDPVEQIQENPPPKAFTAQEITKRQSILENITIPEKGTFAVKQVLETAAKDSDIETNELAQFIQDYLIPETSDTIKKISKAYKQEKPSDKELKNIHSALLAEYSAAQLKYFNNYNSSFEQNGNSMIDTY